jgi:hypothetical protein
VSKIFTVYGKYSVQSSRKIASGSLSEWVLVIGTKPKSDGGGSEDSIPAVWMICFYSSGEMRSKYSPAKPVALACEPLKAAGKAFSASASESVSQSEVAIGF